MKAGKRAGPATDIVMLPAGAPNAANSRRSKCGGNRFARMLRVAGMIEDDESQHRILSAYTGGRVEKLFVNYRRRGSASRPAARDIL